MRILTRVGSWARRGLSAAALGLGLIATPGWAADDPRCAVPAEFLASSHRLPRLASKLALRQGARIVAIGSSSTAGAGASADDRTYPRQLEARLRARFPGQTIAVINKGVGGEDAATNLERFSRDVLSLAPDLVIWQVGTNIAMRGADPEWFRAALLSGVDLLRQTGIDVVLMAPQYAPRFNDTPHRMRFVATVAAVAAQRQVVLFDRHRIMKHWVDSGRMSFADFITPDGLHLNDTGYACVAARLSDQIVDLTRR